MYDLCTYKTPLGNKQDGIKGSELRHIFGSKVYYACKEFVFKTASLTVKMNVPKWSC